MEITIRPFSKEDIPLKVKWINDPENNRYLHYNVPISIAGTEKWFESHIGDTHRFDATIEADGNPCGTIGLLSIDFLNSKAEYYIAMGETELKGKGISTCASRLILEYAFNGLGLNKVYLYTETENIIAQRLFEKVGFKKEGCLKDDLFSHGKFVDRFIYGITKADLFHQNV